LTMRGTAIVAATVVMLWSAASFAGTPTLGPDCGDGAALVGTSSDAAGKLTLGATPTTCTLTFGAPYTNAPACTGTNETNSGGTAVAVGTRTTATTIVLNAYVPWSPGDVISYMCLDY
jgi:hypothetical protein